MCYCDVTACPDIDMEMVICYFVYRCVDLWPSFIEMFFLEIKEIKYKMKLRLFTCYIFGTKRPRHLILDSNERSECVDVPCGTIRFDWPKVVELAKMSQNSACVNNNSLVQAISSKRRGLDTLHKPCFQILKATRSESDDITWSKW